ncbi:hypothetical protein FA227_03145 [Pseudomonas aeruginosa]|nr:hypothetical protein F7O94_09445 [Pseudomonas aeruginosa]MCO3058016.1 hypothetical protein [Pseudomonas aeruginosa]MCO3130297.1 hypothetical protein [Pseudomonas aeruginosa]MCO3157710.1 hypothetical protein [Pseudomonas aeruginosa]
MRPGVILIRLDPGITHDKTPCISNWHCAGGGQDRRTDGLLQGQCRTGNRGRLRTGRAFSTARSGGGIRRRARSHLKPLPAGRLLKRPCKISHNSTEEARGDYDFTPMPIV